MRCEMSTYVVPFLFQVAPQHELFIKQLWECLDGTFRLILSPFRAPSKEATNYHFGTKVSREFKIHYKVAYAIFKPSGLKKLSDHHPTSHGKIARKWKLRRFFSAMRNYRALCLYLKLNFQTRPKIKLGFSLVQMAKMSG